MWTTPLPKLFSGQEESTLHVLDSDIMTGNEDPDHIEAIGQLRSAVSIHPHTGATAEFPALPEVHRLEWVSERLASPRLHLHERDVVPAFHD